MPARHTDRAMILVGSARSRYLAAMSVPSSSSPSDSVVGLQAEREELVVAHDQVVLLGLPPRVGQVGDLGAHHVADHLGQVEDPVRLGDLVEHPRPVAGLAAGW